VLHGTSICDVGGVVLDIGVVVMVLWAPSDDDHLEARWLFEKGLDDVRAEKAAAARD